MLAGGIVLLVGFLRWEGRFSDPVIEPILLKHRPFLAANVYNLLFGAGAFTATAEILPAHSAPKGIGPPGYRPVAFITSRKLRPAAKT